LETRDLLVFNVVTSLAAVHFLLKTKGTVLEAATWLYVLIWILSMVMLLWLRVYGGSSGEEGDVVDYDENLSRQHLPVIFGAVAAIAVVSSLMVSTYTRSSLYIPRPGQVLSEMPFSSGVLDDLLYNFVLVAPAEETVKLMGILALYRKFRNELLSVALPVGFWAALHAYHAYLGELMPVLVVSAFLGGLILYAVLKITNSLENAIIAHGLYNSLVVLTSYV